MSPTRFASEHRWLYIGAIVLLVALAVVGVIRYENVETDNQATKKAEQLADAAEDAGLPRPDVNNLKQALGNDGGQVCDKPGSALNTALWKINLGNGATGPGMRPVIADTEAVRAEAKILEIYCPDKLHKIQDKIDDLKTDDTVRR
ncbi:MULTISPECIES: hypothetical protein [unclassified Streptomyces]|uniref:hypothetical protein n=1 Tax=unclassified Streptomyces TaxID=2593676 RepID=UPI00255399AD|nr:MULTISPECIES: hypothetical protein [unclassified Streptomyces]WRZ69380.1 hypothetical protein OG408_38190 [Streptomyces sp. NBC_01257]WSU63315.1 hypothetical protein OG450_38055 [Streptomyces sp. NBC_01104]